MTLHVKPATDSACGNNERCDVDARVARGPGWELRLGRWQDVLADVETVDAVITDPPYSERTHAGERGSRLGSVKEIVFNEGAGKRCPRNAIAYDALTPALASELAASWLPRCRHWFLAFGDDVSVQWLLAATREHGWVTFAPVGYVKACPPPRFAGDGPTSSLEYLCVARPRGRTKRPGSRPGHYNALTQTGRGGSAPGIVGSKDVATMRAIVRDYSRPGDLVCDPCAGGGTTLLAAVTEGRRAIGAECDPKTFALAVKRLERGYTPSFDFGA